MGSRPGRRTAFSEKWKQLAIGSKSQLGCRSIGVGLTPCTIPAVGKPNFNVEPVSGLGATPVMELYIAYNKVADLLREAGITIHRAYVGNYFTSLEMMGITITLMKLDDELKQLVDIEAESIGLTQLGK